MHFLRLTNCRALKAASVRHNKQTLFLWDARLRLAIIPYQGSFYLPLSYLVGTYIYLWESILECFQCQRIAVKTMYLNKELSKWEKIDKRKKVGERKKKENFWGDHSYIVWQYFLLFLCLFSNSRRSFFASISTEHFRLVVFFFKKIFILYKILSRLGFWCVTSQETWLMIRQKNGISAEFTPNINRD